MALTLSINEDLRRFLENQVARGGYASIEDYVETLICEAKQREYVRNPPPRSSPQWYGEQDENGVDLSLIRENLKLTPLERIRKADSAKKQALRLMEYGRQHEERLKIISLEDLIRVKQYIKRPKDQDSLVHLLAIRRAREEPSQRPSGG